MWTQSHTPFGMFETNNDPDGDGRYVSNPFRFPGQYADPELGGRIFYNWHRYYMPEFGRYNRADPLLSREGSSLFYRSLLTEPIKFNPYLYARNNPCVFSDPLGLCDECDECPGNLWHAEGFGGGGFAVIFGAHTYRIYANCPSGNANFSLTFTCFSLGGGIGASVNGIFLSTSGCDEKEAKNNLLGFGFFGAFYPSPIPTSPGLGGGVMASTSGTGSLGLSAGYGLEWSAGGSYCVER